MPSILDELDNWIEEKPNKTLFEFLDITGKTKESYTYKQFNFRTDAIALHLSKDYNLSKGARVLLVYPPGLEMICAFFACIKSGYVPVPVYPPSSKGFKASLFKMNFIAEDCGAECILTDRAYYWSFKFNRTRKSLSSFSFKTNYISKLKWIITNDFKSDLNQKFERVHSDILFLQYTSGSTNNPKGVIVSHENILTNCANVVDHQAIGVSWLPQYHDMGLIGYYIFFAIKGGTTIGFSPLDFIQRPALWLETISKYKGTASSAPNFAYEYCLRDGKIPEETFEKLDLSSLRFLMTAAEPVRTKIHQNFIDKFTPYGLNSDHIFSAYGLAEFTLAVTNYGRQIEYFDSEELNNSNAISTSKQSKTSLLSCGIALGDTEIRIVKNDEKLDDGQVGEIWLTGNSKCLGYWNKPELTAETFHAKIKNENGDKSWLKTGDLGFIKNNELFISGRSKDMIIIRGQNYYPQDIEVLVEKNSKIRKGCVAAFSVTKQDQELLIVTAEVRNTKELPDAQELNNTIVPYLGVHADEIVFVKARTIPKTSSGKLMRFQTKKDFEQNKLAVVHREFTDHQTKNLTEANTETLVKNESIFEKLFRTYNLSIEESAPLGDAGLDSLRLTEFAHDLKEALNKSGFEDISEEVDLRLLQKIAASELFQLLEQLQTSPATAKFSFRNAFVKIQNEFRLLELEMMKSDVEEFDFEPLVYETKTSKNHDIFLTGGTGFFGPFLIKSLLEQNEGNIYVLVRSSSVELAMVRLLESYAPTHPSDQFLQEFKQRVKPICGDLSRPQLGLSAESWNFISTNIDVIYHNGATVNYLFDYESMRDANVEGTKEVLNLCKLNGGKVLNYVSTTFIFGWCTKDTLFESDANRDMELLDFGYSQSKWVAEQLIEQAKNRGLKVRTFRPALISPSVEGKGSNFDISIRLLAFMAKYGVGTSAKNQVSFTPADLAANNIVAISNLPESLNKTFHVTRDDYANMEEITTLLSKFTKTEFKQFPLKSFVPEVVSKCTKDDLLFPLLNFLLKSVDNISNMEFKRYDNSNYVQYRDLSKWGKQDPELIEVVHGIYKFMAANNIVENTQNLAHA